MRLNPSLAPSGFQEYRLSKLLVNNPEHLNGSPMEHDDGSSPPEAASTRNLLIPAPTPEVPNRFLAVTSADVHEICERACAASDSLHSVRLLSAADRIGEVHRGGGAVNSQGDVLLWHGARLSFFDKDGQACEIRGLENAMATLGDPLAISPVAAGRFRALFCRKVQSTANPLHSNQLSLVELHLCAEVITGEATVPACAVKPIVQLAGNAPILAAAMDMHCCLLLANGEFRENASNNPDPDHHSHRRNDVDDEVDEELNELLVGRGLDHVPGLPQMPAGPAAVLTEIYWPPSGPSGTGACITATRLGRPAVAAWPEVAFIEGQLALATVLRSADGHGAVIRCSRGTEEGCIVETEHVGTFPGLAVLCDTPNFAYTIVSPSRHLAAVVRWRGSIAVELYAHPHGAAHAPLQQLHLPVGAVLRGAHLTEKAVYVWHSRGIDWYALRPGAGSTAEVEDGAEWGAPPEVTQGDYVGWVDQGADNRWEAA